MKTAAPALQRLAEPSRPAARRPFLSQPKPAMGQKGDPWEREADRTADRVTAPTAAAGLATAVTPVTPARLREAQGPTAELERMTQPKVEAPEEAADSTRTGGDDEAAQAKEEPAQAAEAEPAQAREEEPPQAAEEEPVQAQEEEPAQAQEEEPEQAAEEEPAQAAEEPAQAQEEKPAQARAPERSPPSTLARASALMAAARGQGQPLPPGLKDSLEGRFGADFDGVRIHTGSLAVQATRALRAQAVTRGPDIFFNAGRFAPERPEGRHLLAHELTHTLQQGAAQPASDPLQLTPEPAPDGGGYEVRPELLTALSLARGEQGKVNAKALGPDGKRIGWKRLREYFDTAMGGPKVADAVIEKPKIIDSPLRGPIDWLPSWCGIFTWWALKKAGLSIPDWALGSSALDALQQRPAGELPRKGDIVIDLPHNNHFALVTGLESQKDAEGKPKKLTRVATINGNTAGTDNQGGQVQERWDPFQRWTHVIDPVGKLSLPPAAMVTVGRTPTEASEAPAAAGEKPPLAPELAMPEAAQPDLPDVAPPPEPAAEAPPPGISLDLPPRPEVGPAEVVAEVQAADLGTTSEGAVEGYLAASPSAMAAAQPMFAGTVSTRLDGEEKDLADNPPVLAVKSGGLDDIPVQDPTQVTHPDGTVGDGTKGTDRGPIGDVSLPGPAAYAGNTERDKQLVEEESGSWWDGFKAFIRRFMKGIPTTDGSIRTDPGAAPKVDMAGDADATRMSRQRDEAGTKVTGARDKEVTAYTDHPGQASIQPVKVDEERPVALQAEPGEPLEETADTGMADYAAAPIPANVRELADSKVATNMAPKLEKPRAEAAEAAKARDSDKTREIDTAETAAANLSKATDAEERRLVIDNRGKVAKLQGEGIGEANKAVAAFGKDAAGKETGARGEIKTHITDEQGKADKEIADGKVKAEAHKKKGDEDAAAARAKAEKESENDSWWDKVKDGVKSAVRAVCSVIDKVFNAVRKLVKEAIELAKNAAIGLINRARNWVVNKINEFRTWAKEQVDKYLKDAFPGLAKRINGAIDAVANTAIAGVNAVADAAIAGVTALADGLAAALDTILSVFQTALKTAVRVAGAVATGDFAEALRAIIEGACEIAGVDPKPIFDFLDRAGKMIMTILKDPVPFIKNLFGAIGDGFAAFWKNIRTHLITGVIGWLTGALSAVQITGPFEFSVSGILRIVLQVLGLTYENIKAKVIKLHPPAAKVFDVVEKGFELVKKLMTEGPMALLDDIVAAVGNIKDMVLGAIKEWLIVTAIKEGVATLLMMTNPASAIVKAVQLTFRLIMFLVERFQQIKDFVLTVYDGLVAIASGNFAAVTKAVEAALARLIPVLISLLASLLGLGDIARQVTGIIKKVTAPINKVIEAVVTKIVAFVKKIGAKVGALAGKAKKKAKDTAQRAAAKVRAFLWPKKQFQIEAHKHALYLEKKGARHVPYIRSTPTAMTEFVAAWEAKAGTKLSDNDKKYLAEAKSAIADLATKAAEIDKLEQAKKPVPEAKHHEMLAIETRIATALKGLLGREDDIAKAKERYKLEGLAGTYGTVPKPKGDYLTGDHQPQAATLKFLSGRKYFQGGPGAKLRDRASGGHADNAYVVNLQGARHMQGRTYGGKGTSTSAEFQKDVLAIEKTSPAPTAAEARKKTVDLLRRELREDVKDMRDVYKRAGTDPVWGDLDPFTAGDKKAKDTLAAAIRAQVDRGETLVANQPMAELEG